MILVTGGLGFLGVHTARALLDAGEAVVLTRHRSNGSLELLGAYDESAVSVVPVDLRVRGAIEPVLREHEISAVVHLAVPPRTDVSPTEEIRLAADMFLSVITAALEGGIRRIVLASSIAVYFGLPGDVWREDDFVPLEAQHPISAIKRSEETMSSFLAHATEASIVRARITSTWGPGYRTMLNAPSRLALLGAGGHGRLGDRPDPRDAHPEDQLELMHVNDCARALALLATTSELAHDTYNIAGSLVRYGDLVDAVNATNPFEAISLRPPSRDPIIGSRMDTSRLRKSGFGASVTVAAGMAAYVAWLRAHSA